MGNPLSSVAKYLTSIWKSDPPKTGHTFSEQKDSCHLTTTQLVTTNLNQMISDRLPGCTLLKATLGETRDGKLSLHLGTGELFHFSDEKTMHNWLGDKQMADIWEIQDQRETQSKTFFLLQRENRWGYNTFENKTQLFDQLREDYGVLWKLRDLENGFTSYIRFKTSIFGNQYVDVEYQNLATLANTLKLDGFKSPKPTRQSDTSSWGKGIAACVLVGLLASAGKSLVERDNPVSDAIATLGPAAFKAGFTYQMAALNGLDTLPGVLLAGMMFLPEAVKGQSLCPQLVGSYDTPDLAYGIAISGNTAYVADYGSGLQIIDITDKSAPIYVGKYDTPGLANYVAISGNIAYVGDYDTGGLQIIDVSNGTAPTLIGSYNTPGIAQKVVISGNTAYVADDTSGLQIIDVTNGTAPTLIGSYDTPGVAYGVAISDNIAYVADYTFGLQIINVTNGAAPTFMGSYNTSGGAIDVVVSSNTAYIGDFDSGLQIIDVTNAAAPTLVGSYNTPGYVRRIAIFDNIAYLADYDSGLQIINVTNGASPTLLGSYNTPGLAYSVAISGNYALVADKVSGLQIIDWNVPCPVCPELVGSYDTSGQAYGVVVPGNYAYIADYNSGLRIINVSNVTNLTLAGFYDTPDQAFDVAVSGNYAYVADKASGLQIIDVSNVGNLTLAGSYDTPGSARGVVVLGDYAYVADFGSGLQIIDVSNVANPTLAGSYDTPGSALDVAISGNYAYVADMGSGLQIIDISNVTNPTFAGSYDTSGEVHALVLFDNHAYVGDGLFGLQIIDVSNVTNPTLAGFYDTPGSTSGVIVLDDYAYVADGFSGFLIIDVSNVTNPTLAGSYDTPDAARSIFLSSNYAYVADRLSGLQIIDWNIPCFTSTTSSSSTTTSSSTTSSQTSTSITSSSSSSLTTQTSSTTSFSTRSLIPTSSSRERPSTFVTDNFPYLWIILGIGGGAIACCCLAGGTTYFLKQRKRRLDSGSKLVEQGSAQMPTTLDTFKLKATKEKSHTKIGGKYFQLSKISKKEAQEIYEQTGHMITFPPHKKKVRHFIGQGNFGAIKVAQRIETQEYVASKKVKDEEHMKISEQEANLQRSAAGDNILPIYNTIRLEEALYHFMPLAGYGNGTDIQNQLSTVGDSKFATNIINFIAKDILTGLKTIHAKGIYHLDIKPENIVFTKDGTAYITDFGYAKKTKKHSPISYTALGDTRYFSPERLQAHREGGAFDGQKADAWATGMLLLQLLNNQSPIQLFGIHKNLNRRIDQCTPDFFQEKLSHMESRLSQDEWGAWWIIKGLLDPNPETRFTAVQALQAPSLQGLNKTKQAKAFRDLKAERLVQQAGIDPSELQMDDYHNLSLVTPEGAGTEIYHTLDHVQHYNTGEQYQNIPTSESFYT